MIPKHTVANYWKGARSLGLLSRQDYKFHSCLVPPYCPSGRHPHTYCLVGGDTDLISSPPRCRNNSRKYAACLLIKETDIKQACESHCKKCDGCGVCPLNGRCCTQISTSYKMWLLFLGLAKLPACSSHGVLILSLRVTPTPGPQLSFTRNLCLKS